MGKLRFLAALWAAKLSIPALKITRHQGTDFPGVVAVKICPDFLKYMGRPKTIIAVTGTNGKTTVSNILTDILEADGYKVMGNRAGSNIITGVSTAFIRACNLFGKVKRPDIAVIEVDERSSPRVYPYMTPDYVVVTNLFQDSIMRNAHPGFIADLITRYVPKGAKMILNADEMISGTVCPDNPRVYFGIGPMKTDVKDCVNLLNDMRICPKCSGKLEYLYRRYHHVGRFVCADCGFHSPAPDYLADEVNFDAGTMKVHEGASVYDYPLITDNLFNVYNQITVVAMMRQLGMSHEKIAAYMAKSRVPSSRHNEERVGDFTLIRQMSKENNSMAGSRAFDYISSRPGSKEILMMMNSLSDTDKWSENTAWLFDTDFEFLKRDNIHRLIFTGPRIMDYKLRALMAGIAPDKIVCVEHEIDAPDQFSFTPGTDMYLLYGTDSLKEAARVYDRIKTLALSHSGSKEAKS
ncbi:MAG: DUF1727 domain-containing protein [Oscillospiraceae bacterium]|nr:DUF1727 domain-containing protein [Oscillospiraceae bacterium]